MSYVSIIYFICRLQLHVPPGVWEPCPVGLQPEEPKTGKNFTSQKPLLHALSAKGKLPSTWTCSVSSAAGAYEVSMHSYVWFQPFLHFLHNHSQTAPCLHNMSPCLNSSCYISTCLLQCITSSNISYMSCFYIYLNLNRAFNLICQVFP